MIIHFSPYYSANCFTGLEQRNGQVAFGEITVNEVGLLTQLELRLGLSCPDIQQTKRLPDYYQAMRKVMNSHNGNILEVSWQADALGTAKKCLQWRDALVMSGWNADMEQPSDRLTLLAEAEKLFDHKDALCDRWQKVVKALETTKSCFDKEDKIVVGLAAKDALHPMVVQVLELLEQSGTKIEFVAPKASAKAGNDLRCLQNFLIDQRDAFDWKNDKSVRLLQFDTETEAMRYLSTMDYDSNTLWICRNTALLDYNQRMMGLPASGSNQNDDSAAILQLFYLAAAMWSTPYNIRTLLQWLLLPQHPLNRFLRNRLANILTKQGGRDCQKWNDALKAHFEKAAEWEKDLESYKEMVECLLPTNDSQDIKKERLTDFYGAISKWANQSIHTYCKKEENKPLAPYFHQLRDMVDTMLMLLDDEHEETIRYEQLVKWTNTIFNGVNMEIASTQVGSQWVVASPGDMRCHVGQLVWTDCYNQETPVGQADFLNVAERSALTKQGCQLDSAANAIKAQHQAMVNGVTSVEEQLTLVVANSTRAGASQQHPLVIILQNALGDKRWKELAEHSGISKDRLTETKAIHNEDFLQPVIKFENGDKVVMPDHESYSSLDSLVQDPLDYLMSYHVLGLDTMGEKSIDQVFTTQGNVAHAVIERLFKGDAKEIKLRLANDYDTCLDAVIHAHGALLLLPEYEVTRKRFWHELKNSLQELCSIIEENHLKVVRTEMPFNEEGEDMKTLPLGNGEQLAVKGSVDMVLEREDGQWVVFDFKWSPNDKKYQEMLEQSASLQLALYAEMMARKRPIAATAYYILPKRQMITASTELKGNRVKVVSDTLQYNLIDQVKNSYIYRREQFMNGVVENGDNLPLTDTAYGTDESDGSLVQLKADPERRDRRGNVLAPAKQKEAEYPIVPLFKKATR